MGVLVTGVEGQLGHDVVNELERRGHVVVDVDIEETDITDVVSVGRVTTEADVEAVIHCVAYTAVNVAEDSVDVCRRASADGTENIARVYEELDIKMMHTGTDYVFNGQGTRAWEPNDEWKLLNVYGLTKCERELAVECHPSKYFIVRAVWVFGVSGKNFIETILNLGKTYDSITVVDDQVGSPTYTYGLTKLLVDMIGTERYGRYHATNEGLCSWYEFACEIFRQAGMKVAISPVSSTSYPSRAKQSMNSCMSEDKLEEDGSKRLPPWQDTLSRYLQEIEYQIKQKLAAGGSTSWGK